MNNTVLFILLVAMMLFLVTSYIFILIRFTKVDKCIRLLDGRMSATEKHWSKVYDCLQPTKQVFPIHASEQKINELSSNITITWDMEEFANEEEIARELEKDISKQLRPYIEVIVDKDVRRMETNYYARVRIVSKESDAE